MNYYITVTHDKSTSAAKFIITRREQRLSRKVVKESNIKARRNMCGEMPEYDFPETKEVEIYQFLPNEAEHVATCDSRTKAEEIIFALKCRDIFCEMVRNSGSVVSEVLTEQIQEARRIAREECLKA